VKKHLGEDAGAFADGELSPAQMAWAWAHHRSCAWCRDAVDGQREVRAELSHLSGPHIPPQALAALYELVPKSSVAVLDAPGGGAAPRPPSMNRPHAPVGPAMRRRRHRRVATAVSALSLAFIVTVGALYAVGGWSSPGEDVVTGARTLAGANAGSKSAAVTAVTGAEEIASDATLDWLAKEGWSVPTALPDGYCFRDFEPMRWGGQEFVLLELTTPSGWMWVVSHHSHINTGDVEPLELRQLGGRDVYFDLSGHAEAGAFDAGHDLVAFVSDSPESEIAEVIRAYPEATERSAASRVARGWTSIVGQLAG
jgi:hypothetical protein